MHKDNAAHKRKLFAEAYLKNAGNGTQAAIDAGFSKKTAHSAATRLLKRVDVNAMIEAAKARIVAKVEKMTELTVSDLVTELRAIVTSDLRKCFGPDGNLLHPSQWPDDVARSIGKVKISQVKTVSDDKVGITTEERTVELAPWDKNAAIRTGAQILRLLGPDAIPLNAPKTEEEIDIQDAAKRIVYLLDVADTQKALPKPKETP